MDRSFGLLLLRHSSVSLSLCRFSNLFARPDYQVSAVKQYFATAKNLPPAKLYNSTGRGYARLPSPLIDGDARWLTQSGGGACLLGVAIRTCRRWVTVTRWWSTLCLCRALQAPGTSAILTYSVEGKKMERWRDGG